MTNKLHSMPGPVAHILCVLTSLALTLLLIFTGVMFPLTAVLTQRELNLRVAQSPAVLDAQYARIGEKVDALAAKYPFEPKTAMDLISRQQVAAYSAQVIDWRLGLLKPDADPAFPRFTQAGLLEAIQADETFRAQTPADQRVSVSRDRITAGVEKIVTETVAPLRMSLLSLALSRLLPRLEASGILPLLPWIPWLLSALCLALAGLLALLTHKRMVKGVLYMGSACMAAGLCLGAWMGVLAGLDLPARLSAYSAMAALQVHALLNTLALPCLLGVLALLLLGAALVGIHQHRMARLRLTLTEAA